MYIDDCGTAPYRTMWARQLELFNALIERKEKTRDKRDCETEAGRDGGLGEEHLLLVEHPHVYTLGRHGHAENMLADECALAERGIELVRIERGGDITYHGPGQLVVYPILDLQRHHLGVKQYVRLLEEAVIRTIERYGIEGERVEGATGVWIGVGSERERKICAIGVKCRKFVTMHGLALNVNTDLGMFRAINPCGFVDKGVTSMERELGREIPMQEVKERFSREFVCLLDTHIVSVEKRAEK